MRILQLFLVFILMVSNNMSEILSIASDSSVEWIKADVFLNPPADFCSAPFYSLNDKLDTNEIIRQIHGFREGGHGGSFLHSRTGLLIGYMGKKWWDDYSLIPFELLK